MDISALVRDPDRVKGSLFVTDNGKIITERGCKAYVPKRYSEKGLAVISGGCTTLGIFGVVIEDKYFSPFIAIANVHLTPDSMTVVNIRDEEYYEFTFEPGSVFIGSREIVKNDALPYVVYNEFYAKGHIPWYLNYTDVGKIFDTSLSYGGLNLHADHAIFEILTAAMARNHKQVREYYRHMPEGLVRYIALRNIQLQATSTETKLMGSYFRDGMIGALVSPSTRVEEFGRLLRM